MLWIPADKPAFVFGDNKSVVANTTVPGSTIKKKRSSLSYHFIREGCARDEWRQKPLPLGEKHSLFVQKFLYWIYDMKEGAKAT